MSSNVLEKEITLTEILSFVDILKGVEPEFLFDRQMIPKLQVLPFLSNPKMNCSNRNKNNIIEKISSEIQIRKRLRLKEILSASITLLQFKYLIKLIFTKLYLDPLHDDD